MKLPDVDEFNQDSYSDFANGEKETYNKYNNSYAQDYEYLSDRFIDYALDGDPD